MFLVSITFLILLSPETFNNGHVNKSVEWSEPSTALLAMEEMYGRKPDLQQICTR